MEVYNSKHLFGIANARDWRNAKKLDLPMVAGSDSHFAATVGLGVTEIEAADAEEAVEAIRAGQTRVVGKRTPPWFFIGNIFQSIYLIVRKGVAKWDGLNISDADGKVTKISKQLCMLYNCR